MAEPKLTNNESKRSPFEAETKLPASPDPQSDPETADDDGAVPAAEAQDPKPLSLLKSPMFTRAPFILVTEVCERLAYYGIGANIVTYMTTQLNATTSSAAALVSVWSGTCYLTPLLGAWIADAYIGRYHTIWSFSCIYLLGLVLLTLSAGLPSLKPQPGVAPSSSQLGIFWAAMYLIALGTGGIKPCVSAFGADQFDDRDPRQKKMISMYYNYFYAAINVGAILAFTVVVNVQTGVSWVAGFAIPAGSFAVAMVVFLAGSRLYRRLPPGGSPYTRMFKVLGGGIAHRKASIPEDEAELHEVDGDESCIIGQAKIARTHSMKPLERAAVVIKPPGTPDRWLATLTEVEELKCLVRLLPIMLTLIVYNCVYAQMTTLFVLQGGGMDCSLGSLNISPATVNLLDSFSVIIWVFIYDLGISPYFERRGKPISLLWRIGIGYLVAVAAMTAAAVVDIFRMQSVSDNGLSDLNPKTDPAGVPPISVWWQIPQYFLVGMSEVFAMVGSLQLFYQQAPDAMRSTCAALQLLATGLGSYLAAALVAIVQAITTQNGAPGWLADNLNDAHLSYFFWTLAILQAVTLVVYAFIAARFRYRQPVHLTVDTQALALAPEGRGGLAFSVSVTKEMDHDLHAGMVKLDSVRSGAISSSYMQYRSRSVALSAKSGEV